MTQRERQILEWIRQDPMISQQELAEKAGITRSSAAVHISNLMKKGYIAGRGYLLRTAPYIVVVGGVNMDIGAVSHDPLVPRDSNPGKVTTSLGGVGRNIAHNLCLLGQQVSMVTVLGQDSFAQSVRDNAAAIGLDLSHSAVIPGGRTGTYLFIAGSDGDMALAVNDMAIYDHITPDFLRQRLEFINRAGLVVVETNLPEESLQWLCQHCTAPILADPVSTIKARRLEPVLGKLTALKPNRMEAELLSGVTTIRTVGGVADFDTIIRDLAAQGKILSPRVVASNMAVSVPDGHMAGSLAYEAKTPEEAAAYVERIAAEKPDLIKLMITGGVLDAEVIGEPGVLRMQPALVKAACDKAHALGMKVAAHVESPEGVRVALENGVDSIEHGAQPDAAITALYKEKGAFQVATLSPALPYALFDRSVSHATYEQQENGKVVFDGIIAMARENLANGIPVGLGTDTGCPYITHYDMWRELCYFVKYCGVTPAFALHSATLGNPALAGIAGETGSIQPGKCADMIVCAADPLADLTALRTLDMVIKSGYRVEHPQVKKMDNVERELDKFL